MDYERPITNDEMADIACFSPCHFNRLFRNITGIPPARFFYALRLAQAKRLLVETDQSITNICFEVGYSSLGSFVTRFAEMVGVPPGAFRRLGRALTGIPLRELLASYRPEQHDPAQPTMTGRLHHDGGFDGVVCTAVFRRGIPEGMPAACALTTDRRDVVLPLPPGPGGCHVFSVAVPWSATAAQCLTYGGLSRGRSDVARSAASHRAVRADIEMRPPTLLDPPLLSIAPWMILHRSLAAPSGTQQFQRRA